MLAQSVGTTAGITNYSEIIRNASVKRKLISECSAISEMCFQEEETPDLLERAEQAVFDIAESQIREGFQSLRTIITESFKKLESATKFDGYVTGVPTEFEYFDRLTAGLQPSDLIILAARPSMGKTALALNMGYNAAQKTKKWVAVFSLEMSRQQLGIRLLVLTPKSMPQNCAQAGSTMMNGFG